jgi:hypothetical protein
MLIIAVDNFKLILKDTLIPTYTQSYVYLYPTINGQMQNMAAWTIYLNNREMQKYITVHKERVGYNSLAEKQCTSIKSIQADSQPPLGRLHAWLYYRIDFPDGSLASQLSTSFQFVMSRGTQVLFPCVLVNNQFVPTTFWKAAGNNSFDSQTWGT